MPEDSTDSTPPKLKLKSAGESTPETGNPATPEQASAEPKEPARESIIKLRRPIAEDDLTAPKPEPEPEVSNEHPFDPKKPFGDKVTSQQEPAPSSQPVASPNLAPKTQVKTPEPAPIPAPTAAPPIGSLPEPKTGSGVMASLFMILALVVVLGGGGYAIWMVLSEGPAESANGEVSSEGEASSPKSNPIEKAKAAISKIPFLKTKEVVEGEAPAETKPATKVETSSGENAQPGATVSSNTTLPAGDLKSSVSDFLADAHIGGVRSGANARIMLNSESYQVGDVVDPATGLTFYGVKDGKLLFRDKNGIVYAKSF